MGRMVSRLGLIAAALFGVVSQVQASDWKWSITPYIWATKLNADIAVNDQQVANADISFGDLLDRTDLALMIHFEGQKARHGMMFDLYWVTLSDEGGPFPLPNQPGTGTAEAEFDLTIFDAGGIYNPRGDGEGFALLYGARVLDRAANIDAVFDVGPGTIVPRSYETSETLVDVLVGVRYVGHFSPHFTYNATANVSAGGTNLTWEALAGIGYVFGKSDRYTVLAGYRHLDFDFDKERDIATLNVDASLSGAIVGFRFSF